MRPQPSEVPAALIVDIADEAGAVKGRGRTAAAPHIGVSHILFRLFQNGGKGFIGKVVLRDLMCRGLVGVLAHIGRGWEQVGTIAQRRHVEGVPGQGFLAHDVNGQMGEIEVFQRDIADVIVVRKLYI